MLKNDQIHNMVNTSSAQPQKIQIYRQVSSQEPTQEQNFDQNNN